jgi:hypothetical protein
MMSGVLSGASRRAAPRPAAAGRASSNVVARASPSPGGARAPAASLPSLPSQLRTPGGAGGAAAPLPAARRCRVACCARRAVRVSAMFAGLEKMLKGDPGDKTRAKYNSQVAAVNAFAPACAAMTDEQLRDKTAAFRAALAAGATLDSLLPEAFAVRAHAQRCAPHA